MALMPSMSVMFVKTLREEDVERNLAMAKDGVQASAYEDMHTMFLTKYSAICETANILRLRAPEDGPLFLSSAAVKPDSKEEKLRKGRARTRHLVLEIRVEDQAGCEPTYVQNVSSLDVTDFRAMVASMPPAQVALAQKRMLRRAEELNPAVEFLVILINGSVEGGMKAACIGHYDGTPWKEPENVKK